MYNEISQEARKWVTSDESMMSARLMCENFIKGIEDTFKKWTPRELFSFTKVEQLDQPKHYVRCVISK